MSAPKLDPAVVAEWTRKSRAAQGLPATITDPVVLAKIVTLALADQDRGGRKRDGRST
jgi:hypothetical protein